MAVQREIDPDHWSRGDFRGVIGIHVRYLEEARYVVRKLGRLELCHQALVFIGEQSDWEPRPLIVHMGALEEWYEVQLYRWDNAPNKPLRLADPEPLFTDELLEKLGDLEAVRAMRNHARHRLESIGHGV